MEGHEGHIMPVHDMSSMTDQDMMSGHDMTGHDMPAMCAMNVKKKEEITTLYTDSYKKFLHLYK